MTVLYKICPRPLWQDAVRRGRFDGSADDRADGFIHLSTAVQVPGTMARHFAGVADLLLVAVDADRLGSCLRWEPSRRGEVFPHLYGPLALSAVLRVDPLAVDADGRPVLPALA